MDDNKTYLEYTSSLDTPQSTNCKCTVKTLQNHWILSIGHDESVRVIIAQDDEQEVRMSCLSRNWNPYLMISLPTAAIYSVPHLQTHV